MKKHLSQLNRLENNLLISLRKQANGKFLSAFLMFLLMGATSFAQITAFVEAPTANANSALNRGPNGSVDFQRTAAIYTGTELGCFPANASITSIGFNILTAANAAATGTIKVYMVNTTDATFTRSTTWTDLISIPTAMTLVYDGPLTIPAATGFYNISLTTPFAYTGSNFYLAYEWNSITKSAGSPLYSANNDLAASLRTDVGTTAPTTLTGSSAFRPVLRIGYTPPATDASVKAVFTMGKLAVASGAPHAVKAVIRNTGSSPLTNVSVSLNVVGVNTFTNSKTLAAIPAQTDTVVTFDPYTPTAVGNNNVTVSVTTTGDVLTCNNTRTESQQVTSNTMGYADYTNTPLLVTALRTVGSPATTTNGKIIAKFSAGATAVTIQKVRVYIPGDAFNPIVNNAGQTVYATIMNSSGVEIGRSANKVLTAADVDKFVEFIITTPSTPTFTNEDFYVGLAVPTNTSAAIFYAVGAQRDVAIRRGTFFNAPIAGGALTDRADDIVPLIEFEVTSVISSVNAELNNAISVYPNPSNGDFRIQFSNELASAKSVEIRNINGQLVYSDTANASAEVMNVNVKNLAAGVYILQVKSDTQLAVKRLVIE